MTLKKVNSGALTALSILLGLVWLAPLVWLIGTALTEPSFNMSFIPTTPFTTDNLTYVWNAIPFAQYYLNTIILVVVTFAIQFVTSTLAGYALAFYNFRGQALMFVVIFMQIIIPNDVLIIPNFMTLSEMGLIDTKLGIMAPFLGSALAISCSGSTSRPCRAPLARLRASTARTCSRPSGRCTCPARRPRTCPLRSSRSAITGTTTSGR